jgi:RNA recognition motif-containing protein
MSPEHHVHFDSFSSPQPDISALELSTLKRSTSYPSIASEQDAAEQLSRRPLPHGAPHDSVPSPDRHTSRQRTVAQNSSPGWLSAVWRTIMSRAPLLIRSSPALGTASYGAVPDFGSSSDEEDALLDNQDTNTNDTVVRPVRSNTSSQGRSVRNSRHHNGSASSSNWRRRRSSITSEVTMGPDAKTSFGFTPPIEEDKAESSGSSQRTRNESSEDDWTEDNPPDNSQYAEVRASVSPRDNITVSINTPRMWILSMLFAVAGSATNLFFSLRYPSVAITPVIALVLVHPIGKLWDLSLKRKTDPTLTFADGNVQSPPIHGAEFPMRTRLRLWLAQGAWNEKEHACVYISSNVSFGFAFATDVIVEQHKFYKQDVPILYQILLTISTQILGYAFAGLTRRFLVRPASMIWPGTLMSTAMFTTMHKNENKVANGWTISRYRFFVYIWAAACAWYFLPGLFMPALSYFSVVTWFAPKNVVIANLVSVPLHGRMQANVPSSVHRLAWDCFLLPSTGRRSHTLDRLS